MSLRLRLRLPEGQQTLSLDSQASISDLLQEISVASKIPVELIECRSGVPKPSLLEFPKEKSGLASSIVRSGDTIIVSQAASSSSNTNESVVETAVKPAPVASRSSPAPVISSEPPTSNKPEGTYVSTDEGNLVIRVVPDDNSCLFRAVGIVLLPDDNNAVSTLRQAVANKIRLSPEIYSDVILGQPREKYIAAILNPKTWGGAVELSILSEVYDCEIDAVDIATGRIDRYGEGQHTSRAFLLYSGIHYDAVTLSPMPPEDFSTLDFDTRTFPATDDLILVECLSLAEKLKAKHYYTDTANFSLRCNVCKVGLTGEKAATEHAKQTGHTNFGEY